MKQITNQFLRLGHCENDSVILVTHSSVTKYYVTQIKKRTPHTHKKKPSGHFSSSVMTWKCPSLGFTGKTVELG